MSGVCAKVLLIGGKIWFLGGISTVLEIYFGDDEPWPSPGQRHLLNANPIHYCQLQSLEDLRDLVP